MTNKPERSVEDSLMELCEPDTGLIAIGKHDHDVLRKAFTERDRIAREECVKAVQIQIDALEQAKMGHPYYLTGLKEAIWLMTEGKNGKALTTPLQDNK